MVVVFSNRSTSWNSLSYDLEEEEKEEEESL